MSFDVLFEQRALVAEKLKACIRDKGYTKASLGRKMDISGPILDKLLSGTVENKSTFEKYLHKVLLVLGMTNDELIFCFQNSQEEKVEVAHLNIPVGYEVSEKAKSQYGFLMDVLDLCTIYY